MGRYKRGGRFSWEKRKRPPARPSGGDDPLVSVITMILMAALGLLFDTTFWWALVALVVLSFIFVVMVIEAMRSRRTR